MSRSRGVAAFWTVVWFFVAPGVIGGLLPWLISGWDVPGVGVAQVVGAALTAVGVAVVAAAFVQFVVEGRGTPLPSEPTESLVVGGLYRWVRNPMYVFVALIIGGQALLFEDIGVLVLCVVFLATTWLFVVTYEQPTLSRRYGSQYATYCENVPGWYPRLSPWRGEETR
ncbi:MAG: isoprenylcysteine carboxylmethyltransferase family protein [Actinomycetia bacterium]|nr:isoprenylcysteine carboxylmethyltransferase family protein [Actinomycetes bacterium]